MQQQKQTYALNLVDMLLPFEHRMFGDVEYFNCLWFCCNCLDDLLHIFGYGYISIMLTLTTYITPFHKNRNMYSP